MDTLFASAFLVIFGISIANARSVVDGVDIDAYLMQYHYMGKANPNAQISSLMDTDMEEARRIGLSMYQMMWDLEVTGEPDTATLSMMRMKRCGVPDVYNEEDMPNMNGMMGGSHSGRTRKRRYALQGSTWPKTHLTYRISLYTSDTHESYVDRDIAAAFRVWSDVTPLTFTRVARDAQADIDVSFVPMVHGDGFDFDGPSGTLAHAFYPQYGGASHFDDAEEWTIDTFDGINIFQVAAHEFGHALGLKHSTALGALMYPFYQGYAPDFTLPQDDINGIQALYGRKEMPPVVTFPSTTYTPPTMPPHMPNVCSDPSFDAMTIQYIDGKVYTIAFKDDYYMLLNNGGLVAGYPKLISETWEGVTSINAALTREWERDDREAWQYKKITYLFSGSLFYKFVDRRIQGGYPKSIYTEWGLPDNLDAIFQWGSSGSIYSIKGSEYYRHSRMEQTTPDEGYPRPLRTWSSEFTHVDSVFLGNNRQTYFFSGHQHYRFDDSAFTIAAGFPKDNRDEWLGCQAGGLDNENDEGNGTTHNIQSVFSVLVTVLTLLLCQAL